MKHFSVSFKVEGGDDLSNTAIGEALASQIQGQLNVFRNPEDTEPVEVVVQSTGWQRMY